MDRMTRAAFGSGDVNEFQPICGGIEQRGSIPAGPLQRAGIDHASLPHAFIANLMRVAVQQVIDALCDGLAKKRRNVAMREGDALAAIFQDSHGVIDLDADDFRVVGEAGQIIIAVAEDNARIVTDEFFEHVHAAEVAQMNEQFGSALVQRLDRRSRAIGPAMRI